MGEKVGRPKEPSKDELRAGVLAQRMREMERRAGHPDALCYPKQLRTDRKLTEPQFLASDLIGRYYRESEKYGLIRRNPKSQSFEFSTAGASDHVPDDDEKARIVEIRAQWARLSTCIPYAPREAWDFILELCVHERHVPSYVLPDIKIVLDRVVAEFELGAVEEINDPYRRQPRFPRRQPAPSIIPSLKPTRSKPRRTRQERVDRGEFAARTDDAKPGKPSQLTGAAATAAKRDREGLERTLLRRQAEREATEPVT